MANTIKITAVDNELIVLAYHLTGSYELCRILSGNNKLVNVTLTLAQGEYLGPIVLNGINDSINANLNVYLPPMADKYSLLLLGIDWGGPQQFSVNVNGTAFNLPLSSTGDGLVWNPGPIAITL